MAQCAHCKAETFLHVSGVPICIKCADSREAKQPPSDEQVRRLLTEERIVATARTNAALREFNDVMGHFPSGLPYPDGTQRIQNASRKLIAARKEMGRADNRLNDYLGRGIVPDDLKLKRSAGQS